MGKDDIIEEHQGPTSQVSNVVLTPKKDGGMRVTEDMREPNKAIKDIHVSIPRPEDIKVQLAGCRYFSKLDFKSVFY